MVFPDLDSDQSHHANLTNMAMRWTIKDFFQIKTIYHLFEMKYCVGLVFVVFFLTFATGDIPRPRGVAISSEFFQDTIPALYFRLNMVQLSPI